MIKVGDLVMVVRPLTCCGEGLEDIGNVFKVVDLWSSQSVCAECGKVDPDICAMHIVAYGKAGFPFNRLIKIDPPANSESTKYDQEIEVRV
jgi:hypothetical protein